MSFDLFSADSHFPVHFKNLVEAMSFVSLNINAETVGITQCIFRGFWLSDLNPSICLTSFCKFASVQRHITGLILHLIYRRWYQLSTLLKTFPNLQRKNPTVCQNQTMATPLDELSCVSGSASNVSPNHQPEWVDKN